jgi:protein-tyrosine kinase
MSRIHEALQQAQRELHPELPQDDSLEILNAPILETHLEEEPSPIRTSANGLEAAVQRTADAGDRSYSIAAVPRTWRPDRSRLLFLDTGEIPPAGVEQLRTLRSRLYQVRSNRPLKLILMASAMPSEGKSFMAANLAHSFVQQAGRRCLVIDADLRRATLHQYFGAPASPGLTDYLRGQATMEEIIQQGQIPGLSLITAGAVTNEAAELIGSPRLRELLQACAPQFDWVVIDSPPALAVSDSSRIADLCDGVVLVVRAGQTSYEAARKARAEFRDGSVLGLVLNDCASSAGYAQYYYSGPSHHERTRRQ